MEQHLLGVWLVKIELASLEFVLHETQLRFQLLVAKVRELLTHSSSIDAGRPSSCSANWIFINSVSPSARIVPPVYL